MSAAHRNLKHILLGILIAVAVPALAFTSYNYFAPGGALSCVSPCTQQAVDLTQSGFVSGPLRTGAGGTGTNSTLSGLVRGGSPMSASELSGDVTTSGSNATTIGTNVVNNTKLAQMPANTFKGNNTAALANASDLTVAQMQSALGITTAPIPANPSGLIGLTATNGVASTYTRSDATHALDQSISPIWTGTQIFRGALTRGGTTTLLSPGLVSGIPMLGFTDANAGTDQKSNEIFTGNSGEFVIQTQNEAANNTHDILRTVRGTGIAISSLTLGNSTDTPLLTLAGAAQCAGSAPTVAGIGAGCAVSTIKGCNNAGSFLSGTTGTCEVQITFTKTANNGWSCTLQNASTAVMGNLNGVPTQTTADVRVASTSGNTLVWSCMGF